MRSTWDLAPMIAERSQMKKSNLNCIQDHFQCRIKSSNDDLWLVWSCKDFYEMYSSLQKTFTSLKWTFVISYKTLKQKTNGYTSVPNLLQNSFNAHCTSHTIALSTKNVFRNKLELKLCKFGCLYSTCSDYGKKHDSHSCGKPADFCHWKIHCISDSLLDLISSILSLILSHSLHVYTHIDTYICMCALSFFCNISQVSWC